MEVKRESWTLDNPDWEFRIMTKDLGGLVGGWTHMRLAPTFDQPQWALRAGSCVVPFLYAQSPSGMEH